MLCLSSRPDPVSSAQDKEGRTRFSLGVSFLFSVNLCLCVTICMYLHVCGYSLRKLQTWCLLNVCVCGRIQASIQPASETPVKHSGFLAMLAALLLGWECWSVG